MPSLLSGIATTRHGHGLPTRRIKVVEAGHPVPDEAGLKGAEDSLRLAEDAGADDLLLVLLSGGGSANWIAPANGVSFAQKQQVTRALLRSGAPIGEVNTVRKHLSRIKGGRLARAGRRAEIVTLAISDVPHDDPSAIASGPTVPDPTTLADARAIVRKYGLAVDAAVGRALEDPRNESCKPGDPAFARARFELIARPRASLDAAAKIAGEAGYAIVDLGADLEGEARSVAADHARLALQARAEGRQVAILSGGELTVTVRGHGRGGPNQEYALALAGLLRNSPAISVLAADTDGADGGAGSAADPAGAMVDPATFAKMASLRTRSPRLSRQQRRHRLLRRHRRSLADRPDAHQCQRRQGDFGGRGVARTSSLRARVKQSILVIPGRASARARNRYSRSWLWNRGPAPSGASRNDGAHSALRPPRAALACAVRTRGRWSPASPAARRGWWGPAAR